MSKKIVLFLGTVIVASILMACQTQTNTTSGIAQTAQVDQTEQAEETVQTKQPEVTAQPEQKAQTQQTKDVEATQDAVTYRIKKQTYKKDLIQLHYPKISGLENKDLQKQCNKILVGFAKDNLKDFTAKDTYELKYEVATKTKDLISIVLRGYVNYEQSAHPSFTLYTLNVDLAQDKIVRLSDREDVEVIAKKIIDKSGYEFNNIDGEKIGGEWKKSMEEYLSQYTVENLADELRNYDVVDSPDTRALGYSYYKEGKLHICISVPHVLGDYVELVFK